MASADFYGRTAHVALTLHEPCLHQSRYCRLEDRPQTSPVNDNNFHPMWPLYLPADLAVGLHHFLQTRPVNRPCIQFLFVGPGLCHRASFTRPLAWSHLPSASGSALGSTAPTVDFHHLVIARAGQTEKRRSGRLFSCMFVLFCPIRCCRCAGTGQKAPQPLPCNFHRQYQIR
jgi:hypothetical protein